MLAQALTALEEDPHDSRRAMSKGGAFAAGKKKVYGGAPPARAGVAVVDGGLGDGGATEFRERAIGRTALFFDSQLLSLRSPGHGAAD